jgi:ribonucleotide monophosphatase NagD (HAD superfamily)
MLERALQRGLPFVCANPDLIVDVGGTILYCAGAIADIYQHMGGAVFWAGKPHLSAYETNVGAYFSGSTVGVGSFFGRFG